MSETKQKKPISRRESLRAGRRKSSVPQLEEVVFKAIDVAEASGSTFADKKKDKKSDEHDEEQDQNWESVRRCLCLWLYYSILTRFSFRNLAYFEQDGARRGYIFDEPEGMDLFIDEQMKEITDRESKEKEEAEQKKKAKFIKLFQKTAEKNN